jgi:hypothetical protein
MRELDPDVAQTSPPVSAVSGRGGPSRQKPRPSPCGGMELSRMGRGPSPSQPHTAGESMDDSESGETGLLLPPQRKRSLALRIKTVYDSKEHSLEVDAEETVAQVRHARPRSLEYPVNRSPDSETWVVGSLWPAAQGGRGPEDRGGGEVAAVDPAGQAARTGRGGAVELQDGAACCDSLHGLGPPARHRPIRFPRRYAPLTPGTPTLPLTPTCRTSRHPLTLTSPVGQGSSWTRPSTR